MNNYYFDFETTGIDVLKHEIITGYFLGDHGLDFEVKIKPIHWCYEAEKIHGISKKESDSFSEKTKGLISIVQFMKNNPGCYYCYANENNFGQRYQYDYAILKNEMFRLQLKTGKRYYYRFLELFENGNDYQFKSVHTLAKQKLKGKLKKFGLEHVVKYLGIEYKLHHDAKADVLMTKKVYDKLMEII